MFYRVVGDGTLDDGAGRCQMVTNLLCHSEGRELTPDAWTACLPARLFSSLSDFLSSFLSRFS